MRYDLNSELQRADFLARAQYLARQGGEVELTQKRQRPKGRAAYLHLLIELFALEWGDGVEYCKIKYFKATANPDLFWVDAYSERRGQYRRLRSIKELSEAEQRLSAERFRAWAEREGGIYLPSPEEAAMIAEAEKIINHTRQYL